MSKPFVRSTSDKYIAGVCGGIAAYFGIDPTFVRIGAVLLAIFVQPIGWMVYPALWLLMPTDTDGASGMSQLRDWMKQGKKEDLR